MTVTRYCKVCKGPRKIEIVDTDQPSYHDDDASAICCTDCGDQLGHAVFWPQSS